MPDRTAARKQKHLHGRRADNTNTQAVVAAVFGGSNAIPTGVVADPGVFPEVFARAVEAATAEQVVGAELNLEVLISRIVEELYREANGAGTDPAPEAVASLLDLLRAEIVQSSAKTAVEPPDAGRGFSGLPMGVFLSSLVSPDPQAAGANETVALLKSLLEQLGAVGGADEQLRGEPGRAIAALPARLIAASPESNSSGSVAPDAPIGNAVAVGRSILTAESQGNLTQNQVPAARNGAAEIGVAPQATGGRNGAAEIGVAPPATGDRNVAGQSPGIRVSELQSVRSSQSPPSSDFADEAESETNPAPARNLAAGSRAAETLTRVQRGAQPVETTNPIRAAADSPVADPPLQSRGEATTSNPGRPGAAVVADARDSEAGAADAPAKVPVIQSDSATADRPLSAPTGSQSVPLQGTGESIRVDNIPTVQQRPNVAAQIVRAAEITIERGGGTVRLQLEPPELGRINLAIKVAEGGVVTMHIISESAEARSIVQSQLGHLQTALQDRGFEVGNLSVAVSDQGENSDLTGEESEDVDSESDLNLPNGFQGSEDDPRQVDPFAHDGLIDYRF